MKLKDLKVGTKIKKEQLGEIGNLMEEDPKVICISYKIYDKKSGVHCEFKIKAKDYERIMKELEDEK